MSRINRIQNEIKQLEGGRFQNLCDAYLYKKKSFENIVSHGSMEGTDKTTIGIPDTYFFDQRTKKYILVMYGTRKDTASKLESDIKEAIEKTKISKKEIQEIICCHTSSNISIKKDKELRKLSNPIKLTLIGIDTLSHDLLSFQYQELTKDYLGIIESTEQVWDTTQFISIHDKSKTNAPIDISFIDETNIIEGLLENIKKHQIVLLYGAPGTGKTKIAIEACKKLSNIGNVMCVKSNSMPVYQDIKESLSSSQINYLFLDDANIITNIGAIVNLLRLEEYEKNLKIIMTVRDYALSKIKDEIKHFDVKVQNVSVMSDDEIKLLVENIKYVSNEELRTIIKLSRNNPRIAVLAAIMMRDKRYEFFENGSEILECYYRQIIEENNLSTDEVTTLFILSFQHKVNLSAKETFEDLLIFFKIDFTEFVDALTRLHDKELCDIFQNKAAKISDQSLSDYILIEYVGNKRIFKIRDFIKELFPRRSKEIVNVLNIITTFNSSKEWLEYLTDEIKFSYNEIIKQDDEESFLHQYAAWIPIEALAYVCTQVENMENVKYKISQKEFEEKIRYKTISDPIINIICTISDSEKIEEAGYLLIEYAKKRQDKICEVYLAIKEHFSIEKNSDYYFEKRDIILKNFLHQNTIDEVISLLIVNSMEHYLGFSGDAFYQNGKHGEISRYRLVDGDYLIQLHEKIFDVLYKVYSVRFEETNRQIEKLLYNYPVYEARNNFNRTVLSDIQCIKNLFFNDVSKLGTKTEAIVYKLKKEVADLKLEYQPFLDYIPSDRQKIYIAFSDNMLDYRQENIDFLQIEEKRIQELLAIHDSYSKKLLKLFNILASFQLDELLNKDEIEKSIYILYLELNQQHRMEMLSALLSSDFIIKNFHFDYYMKELTQEEGISVLNSIKKELDERWYISNLLTREQIMDKDVDELMLLLKNLKDDKNINSFSLLSFTRYIEKNIIVLQFLFKKYKQGSVIGTFFIPEYQEEEEIQKTIKIMGCIELKNMYLNSLRTNELDASGNFFRYLVRESGEGFICEYLVSLRKVSYFKSGRSRNFHLRDIWDSQVAEEEIICYIEYLINNKDLFFNRIDSYLEEILKSDLSRSFKMISQQIDRIEDEEYLVELYNIVLETFSDDDIVSLFEKVKNKKVGKDFLNNLHLTMRVKSWSGSLVPLLDKEIIFLNRLLDKFKGIENIKHALAITEMIEGHKKQKEYELLSDFLD